MCLHFLLLEVVLLTAGRLYGMYEGIYNGIWFAFSVFAVYILVRVVSYLLDQRTAELLNKKLKERRRGLK